MPVRSMVFTFLLIHVFSHNAEDRKATPKEELEDVEKIVSGMADMKLHENESEGGRLSEEEIDEIMLDGLDENEGIIRKSFDSVAKDARGDLSTIMDEMPRFYGEMVEVSRKTFTIKLSHDELPSNIPFYEFVVLRLDTDSEGYPRLPKENSRAWQNFIPYTKEPAPGHPYIAARFTREDLPRKFTVGDNLVSL